MLEIDNSVISANELLQRVRENVLKIDPNVVPQMVPAERGTAAGLSLSDEKIMQMTLELDSVLENIQIQNKTWYHQDAQITCRFKVLRPIVIFFKRAVRKTIYWFTQPYVEQQNAFNGATTRAISDSLRMQRMLLEQLREQR